MPALSPPTNAQQLHQLGKEIVEQIQRDIQSSQALLNLLENERQCLKAREFEALEDIIRDKALHLQQLESSAKKRTEWAIVHQQQSQAADISEAWQSFLTSLQIADLQQQWAILKDLLVRCRSENEVNGKLMTRSQQTFGRLLNLLRGQVDAPSLYTQTGGKSGSQPGQQLGEA